MESDPREARYYILGDNGWITCTLCPKFCKIKKGGRGFCRIRVRQGDRLVVLNYARCASYGLDPIEKKPLYHFYPGHSILSLGTVGCNLACSFCQNWQISQDDAPTFFLEPATAVEVASNQARDEDCIGLAYTYSEPIIWFEYVLDTASLARRHGLKNVLVTNGFISEEPLEELLQVIDGLNIDLKSFSRDFYIRLCKGLRDPVMRTIELCQQSGRHVEVTTLIIPGKNDHPEEIEALAAWLAGLDAAIPLHLSRFFPNYKLDLPPTPLATMEEARKRARRHLKYVYLGNVHGEDYGNTFCPQCDKLVISRRAYAVGLPGLTDDNRCVRCGEDINITGKARENPIGW